jgi:hypothetical protein
MNTVLEIGSFLTSGYDYYQSEQLAKKLIEIEEKQHQEEIEQMKIQHQKELLTAKQTFLISSFTDIEQYCQELNENLVNTARDSERDMVDQRNQQFQTVLLAATLVLAANIALLIQGTISFKAVKCKYSDVDSSTLTDFHKYVNLANNSSFTFKILYSVSTAGAILTLLISCLICIEMTIRVTNFMFRRSEYNMKYITKALQDTRDMRDGLSSVVLKNKTQKNSSLNINNTTNDNIRTTLRKEKSKIETDAGLDDEWNKHENEIHEYLHKRSQLNRDYENAMINHGDGETLFENFWDRTVKQLSSTATILFYIGTVLTQIAHMIFMWTTFTHCYGANFAALMSVSIILLSILFCLAIAVYLRNFDPGLFNYVIKMKNIEEIGEKSFKEKFKRKKSYKIFNSFHGGNVNASNDVGGNEFKSSYNNNNNNVNKRFKKSKNVSSFSFLKQNSSQNYFDKTKIEKLSV